MQTACIICDKIKLAREQFADELVWEFTESIAFLGPWQYYEGYCIVTARRHVTELFDLTPQQRHTLSD